LKFRRQVSTEDSVNLTPMIDVVFLLLIFFMVSTTFTKETHLSIDLPEASGEVSVEKKDQIEIVINAQGGFSVNGESVENTSLLTLRAAILKKSDGDTSLPMIITADAQTPHQSFVTAMSAAAQLGFNKLSITAKNPVESEQ